MTIICLGLDPPSPHLVDATWRCQETADFEVQLALLTFLFDFTVTPLRCCVSYTLTIFLIFYSCYSNRICYDFDPKVLAMPLFLLYLHRSIRTTCKHVSFPISSVADQNRDLGSGAFLTPGSRIRIRDPGWKKILIRIQDPG